MDPNYCYKQMLDAIHHGDDFTQYASDLRVWILRGGFLPDEPKIVALHSSHEQERLMWLHFLGLILAIKGVSS